MKSLKIILIALFLLIFVGCTTNKPLTQIRIEKLKPPAHLLATPPLPRVVPVTVNRDLFDNWKEEEASRKKAFAQIQEIKKWSDAP